jgi:hypothetical protein
MVGLEEKHLSSKPTYPPYIWIIYYQHNAVNDDLVGRISPSAALSPCPRRMGASENKEHSRTKYVRESRADIPIRRPFPMAPADGCFGEQKTFAKKTILRSNISALHLAHLLRRIRFVNRQNLIQANEKDRQKRDDFAVERESMMMNPSFYKINQGRLLFEKISVLYYAKHAVLGDKPGHTACDPATNATGFRASDWPDGEQRHWFF